jgi:hypothetical protein
MQGDRDCAPEIANSDPQIADFVGLYGMVSRMRVLSTPRTAACADKIMLVIIDT